MKIRRFWTLLLVAIIACMPMSVFAEGIIDDSTLENEGYLRIYGQDRYGTSAEIAKFSLAYSGYASSQYVIIASGLDYPDALGASYVSNASIAPIILTSPSKDSEIAEFVSNDILHKYDDETIKNKAIIMGGAGAVSDNFLQILGPKAKDAQIRNLQIERWAGKDRYETNLKALKNSRAQNEEFLICSGESFADCLSASGTGLPIMIVGKKMTDEQIDYLSNCGSQAVTIVGGTAAVSTTVENQLRNIPRMSVYRLNGVNRYETSYLIAKEYFRYSKSVVLTYGENFPDGLSGCSVSFVKNAPMLLCTTNNMSYVQKYVNENSVNDAVVLGGPALISDQAVRNLGLK